MTETFKIAPHRKIMQRLEDKGFEAFLVGGCVRDMKLRRHAKDYDVTTDATPDQIRAIFQHTIPVGAKFGVVVVIEDGEQIEVATFRADGAYTDGRRPDEVTYSKSAKEDVIRRDFTMNGLLMNNLGDTVDYVGGIKDIENKIIRAIGDPSVRFAEDALRMMRACRFAAQLGFEIESKTLAAIEDNARLMSVISKERVAMELFKMLAAPYPLKGLVPFSSTGLFRFALPTDFSDHIDMVRTIQRFGQFNANKDGMLGMAMLFADMAQFYAEGFANYLKFSTAQRDELVYMKDHVQRFRQHMNGSYRMTEASLKRELRQPGVTLALEIMSQDEVMGVTSFGVEALMTFVLKLKAYKPEEIKPKPLINGKDLLDAGIPSGPIFTDILFDIESFQLNGVFTTKEQAMDFVRNRAYKAGDGWVYQGLSPREVQEQE
jgi:poly(A) polymerase